MAWSAAVRRDVQSPAAPLPQLDSLSSSPSSQEKNKGISVAVIDANVLISYESSAKLLALAFSSSPRLVTVKEVLDEVRAPASRFHLASLPTSVDCIEPTDEALHKVLQFARRTGDLQSLSDVDLKLLALTYMLEEQNYGSAHLRSQPPPLQVTQVKYVREHDLPGWGSNVQNLEEWEELSQEADDAADQSSHILGLKKLCLSSSEQDNVVVEEQKHDSPKKAEVSNAENSLFDEIDELTTSSLPVREPHERLLKEDTNNEEKIDEVKPLVEEDGGDWERTISRSTRRKHERRAARAFMTCPPCTGPDVESVQTLNTADTTSEICCEAQNSQCQHDVVNDEADGSDKLGDICELDAGCPAASESCYGEEEELASTHGAQSEDSWTLRSLSQSKVACVTTDFPMQNVLLQIGLRAVSLNGLQIQQLHRWALKCEACRNVTTDVGRIFCPKCGNGGTLYKVSITTGPNGVVHTGTRKRTNIRGTKYSLPLPKGGREGVTENPILREDQLPQKMLRPKNKVSHYDLSSAGEIFAMKSGGKEKIQPPIREALAIFSGKRNPNRCRPKQRG